MNAIEYNKYACGSVWNLRDLPPAWDGTKYIKLADVDKSGYLSETEEYQVDWGSLIGRIIAFQNENKLDPDGNLGPATLRQLQIKYSFKPEPIIAEVAPKEDSTKEYEIGSLSAWYESGSKGSSAIGWDSTGSSSYGKYQIASRTGTMNMFLNFLKNKNSDYYTRLMSALPADTGGTQGKFPDMWRKIASEGNTLTKLEHEFIKETHYAPVFAKLNSNLQQAVLKYNTLKDIIWSLGVQHGSGAAPYLANNAWAQSGGNIKSFINILYELRKTQFGNSTPQIQQAAANRMNWEKSQAYKMIAKEGI